MATELQLALLSDVHSRELAALLGEIEYIWVKPKCNEVDPLICNRIVIIFKTGYLTHINMYISVNVKQSVRSLQVRWVS